MNRKNVDGFALLDALVSMLIFALGILGLLGLQASMVREQGDAKYRADAALLVNELFGIMWSDISNMSSYQTANCNGYSRCSGWLSKVNNSLPNGSAAIQVTTDGTGDVSVAVSWTLPSGDTHTYNSATTIVSAK